MNNQGDKTVTDTTFDKYQHEMNEIDRLGKDDSNIVVLQEMHDHKNISLWTQDGQRKGPMHPKNAKRALDMFRKKGILLSTRQPSKEEVDAYKASKAGKVAKEKTDASRTVKNKSKRKGAAEAMAQTMAKEIGKPISELTNIMKQNEVGKKK